MEINYYFFIKGLGFLGWCGDKKGLIFCFEGLVGFFSSSYRICFLEREVELFVFIIIYCCCKDGVKIELLIGGVGFYLYIREYVFIGLV